MPMGHRVAFLIPRSDRISFECARLIQERVNYLNRYPVSVDVRAWGRTCDQGVLGRDGGADETMEVGGASQSFIGIPRNPQEEQATTQRQADCYGADTPEYEL